MPTQLEGLGKQRDAAIISMVVHSVFCYSLDVKKKQVCDSPPINKIVAFYFS
jgi:hypothetical protein